jgi:hypothetical protein
MSQIKYKFVNSEGIRKVTIPEGIKTIEEIENYLVKDMNKVKSGGFNVVRLYRIEKNEFKFDHNKKAFKWRIFP